MRCPPPGHPDRYLFFSRPPPDRCRSADSSPIHLAHSTSHPPTHLQRPPRVSVRRTHKHPAISLLASTRLPRHTSAIKPQSPSFSERVCPAPTPHCPPDAQPPHTTVPPVEARARAPLSLVSRNAKGEYSGEQSSSEVIGDSVFDDPPCILVSCRQQRPLGTASGHVAMSDCAGVVHPPFAPILPCSPSDTSTQSGGVEIGMFPTSVCGKRIIHNSATRATIYTQIDACDNPRCNLKHTPSSEQIPARVAAPSLFRGPHMLVCRYSPTTVRSAQIIHNSATRATIHTQIDASHTLRCHLIYKP